jgi:hypothetical protein
VLTVKVKVIIIIIFQQQLRRLRAANSGRCGRCSATAILRTAKEAATTKGAQAYKQSAPRRR